MEYTYKGKDYPKELNLNFPEIRAILSKPKDDITFGEASHLLSLDADKMQDDCLNLILNEVGNQFGKTIEELRKDPTVNPYIINNTLIFLSAYISGYDKSVSEVLLELLRQTKDFLAFNNLGLAEDYKRTPIAAATFICYDLNPNMLIDILLENGISDEGKKIAAYMIGIIATQLRRHYDGVDAETYDELCDALKDAFRKHAKEYPANIKLDRFSLNTLVETMSTVGVHDLNGELENSVRHLFEQGYIDEAIINEEDAIDGMYNHGWDSEPPVTDVRELLFPSIE